LARSVERTRGQEDACCPFAGGRTVAVNLKIIGTTVMATNLLQQIVNVEVHLKDRLFPAFVM